MPGQGSRSDVKPLSGLRNRSAEKAFQQESNRADGIRYPITVDLALSAHECAVIIQTERGGVDHPVQAEL